MTRGTKRHQKNTHDPARAAETAAAHLQQNDDDDQAKRCCRTDTSAARWLCICRKLSDAEHPSHPGRSIFTQSDFG